MNKHLWKQQLTPYEADYARWCTEQGALLRGSRLADLDRDNLAEEIESLGRSQKHEIRSRMKILIQHLLKWEFRPQGRSNSWQSSISEQRTHIAGLLADSPSLKDFPAEAAVWAYPHARWAASIETALPEGTLPLQCPYSPTQLLDEAFMPGEIWTPSKLARD
ncbi:MAG: DUF29 domain-containing protein [Rhizobiaceae bacterium]